MAPELNDGEKQKNLDQEVREMISTLTARLGSIQRSNKTGSSSSQNQDEEEQGVRIITLAGSNLGATMRGDVDGKAASGGPQELPPPAEQEDSASYVVNSNFQAINNSIMLGGSYDANDPGVHLDIADHVEQNDVVHKHGRKGRKGRRGSHHHAERSDNRSDTDGEKS
ncbi:hypothetical protein C2S53_004584 [Perilla frutescens var. hirtella]|uniref:Uncharacterized protein n=1 Tax=Perilla frutescens var. hirtella TaxID=608512 RepID=A0AAD4PCH1_PERFH|nr:hypothetical protein C2S53_004584 [Perilla frutescens var. hirtella]